jgi:hypothetical protein
MCESCKKKEMSPNEAVPKDDEKKEVSVKVGKNFGRETVLKDEKKVLVKTGTTFDRDDDVTKIGEAQFQPVPCYRLSQKSKDESEGRQVWNVERFICVNSQLIKTVKPNEISENHTNHDEKWELRRPNTQPRKNSNSNKEQRTENKEVQRNHLCLICKNYMSRGEIENNLCMKFCWTNYVHAACVFQFYPNFIASNPQLKGKIEQCMIDFLKELVDNNHSQMLRRFLGFVVFQSWSNQMLYDLENYFLQSVSNRFDSQIKELMSVFIEMRLAGGRSYEIDMLHKIYNYAFWSGKLFIFETMQHRDLHQGKVLLVRLIDLFPVKQIIVIVNQGYVKLRNSKECERVLIKLLEKIYCKEVGKTSDLSYLFRTLNEIHLVFKLLHLMENVIEGCLTNPWNYLNKLFVEEDVPDFEIIRAIEIGMTFLLGKMGQQLYKPFQGTMWTVFEVCTYLGQKINLNLQNYVIALSLSDSVQLKVVKLHLYTIYSQPHFKDTLIEAIQALEKTATTQLRIYDNNRIKHYKMRKLRQEYIKDFLVKKMERLTKN